MTGPKPTPELILGICLRLFSSRSNKNYGSYAQVQTTYALPSSSTSNFYKLT